MELTDKSVLIIGGSSGIGLGCAAFARGHGARVTIASRSAERLRSAAASVGADVEVMPIDVTNPDELSQVFEGRTAWDHIVVSAASTKSGGVRTLPLEDAHAAMHSKFWGAYHVARYAKINPGGSLTLVSGYLSERPSAGAVLQGAINAGLEALARGLALELAPVRVNVVSPGLIDTPIWNGVPDENRQAMFRRAAESLPVRTTGHALDIAHAAHYLMTTPFATGTVVRVDGGAVIAS